MEEKKQEITIQNEIVEAIALKSGYSLSQVQNILRGYVPRITRHDKLFELYEKAKQIREKYLEELKNL